ncbi:TPA: DUF4262 domain-containing protein [Vibrio vulnificus]|uniref:DUF4262 domain-containing protein n=1 Tax=Vibrio vulnificus TaxID=672 RepID=UPI001029068C|nr:DUF4262 domain-containing protein [Vibrio vulnificus]EGR0061514.1 DUF4262 domain-containing protein [Vibrio vulnificus]EHD2242792.1 DUF4262 domain-containing protein [Vibrio vulnificus]EIJ0971166.1 DUF4262 domain-containing protein [Vibrio vulnificus]EIO4059650.1 DUF4262 domain-containing protein [Vibrio vulnificus]EIU7060314.1 DUF4262 domain-containing protein [Vibrio vulnificus]
MKSIIKQEMHDKITSNISNYGYHVYIISGGQSPRYAYTIGLSQKIGQEIVLSGAAFFSNNEVKTIIDHVASQLASSVVLPTVIDCGRFGQFSQRVVDSSWSKQMLLGALDYFELEEIEAIQILPDKAHWTYDIPDMSKPFNVKLEPVWKYLSEAWDIDLPESSVAVTDLDVLQGVSATEVMRWEEGEWEIFSSPGPDIPKQYMRIVPLSTLLAIDKSLYDATKLDLEKGLWRSLGDEDWNNWN